MEAGVADETVGRGPGGPPYLRSIRLVEPSLAFPRRRHLRDNIDRMGRSPMPKSHGSSRVRVCWTAGVQIAMLVLASAPLFALNPNHKITQYVHRIWQAQPDQEQHGR